MCVVLFSLLPVEQKTRGKMRFIPMCLLVVVSLLMLSWLYQWNQQRKGLTGYDYRNCDLKEVSQSISKLKNEMIIFPDYKTPYNLKDKTPNKDYSQYKEVPRLFQKYFPKKRNGFFIECGAYDGETYSNTLQAELNLNWTGILIEAEHGNFESLKSKHRKSFILEACLANVCGIKDTAFHGVGSGALLAKNATVDGTSIVKCVSIADVLSALGVKHIDWMVLDTEGNEPDIIKSFPFHSVTVDLIQAEMIVNGAVHHNNARFFQNFLGPLGFVEDASTFSDIIFRRNASNLPDYNEHGKFGNPPVSPSKKPHT